MKLFYAIYGLAGLYSIFTILHHAWLVIRKREKLTSAMFGELDILIFTAFMLTSCWQTINSLKRNIPDDTYTVTVGVQYPGQKYPALMAADIYTIFDVRYEDRESWSGGWEHTVTDAAANMRYNLCGLYTNGIDHAPIRMDCDVEPNSTITEDINGKTVEISIGTLSAEALGISAKDNWDALSTSQKAEKVLIPGGCAVGLIQMFLLDEERKSRVSEWYKTSKR